MQLRLPRDLGLPKFPWDTLAQAREVAAAHPDGLVDLTVGGPVDPTPEFLQEVLRRSANAPGYPPALGSAEVRGAIIEWFARRRRVPALRPENVTLTVGSKEAVASLPLMLGVGPGDTVGYPNAAYPTYQIGAVLAGAREVVLSEDPQEWPEGADAPVLVWINSPRNPDGHVLGVERLRQIVLWARRNGAVIASDECYAELAWEEPWVSGGVPSLLDPRVTDGDMSGLLVAYSLSKQSNLAGYRAAFLAGDAKLMAQLAEARKHWGLMTPGPIAPVITAALGDEGHVAAQREVYGKRRRMLLEAFSKAGFDNDNHSQAGLYLWLSARHDTSLNGREMVAALAKIGILVTPGDFYGITGKNRIRVSLTASDDDILKSTIRLQKYNLAASV